MSTMTIGTIDRAVHAAELDALDDHVRDVAARLPFEVDLTADMGGTFVLQIDLGTNGGTADAIDRAGIDPGDDGGAWWIEAADGELVECSDLTIASDVTMIAAWIASRARALGCPAAQRGQA